MLALYVSLTSHLPRTSADWTAFHFLTYGRPACFKRNLPLERQALTTFVRTYRRLPTSNLDWRILNFWAYQK